MKRFLQQIGYLLNALGAMARNPKGSGLKHSELLKDTEKNYTAGFVFTAFVALIILLSVIVRLII